MLLAALAALATFPDALAAATVYVDARAEGGGDGTSWAKAFARLEDALLLPGPIEIWVAAGTYAPAPPAGDRNAAFRFGTGQALYGGFRGDETSRSQRDPALHATVLTGDLNGDDLPGFENYAENSYHVLRCRDADATALVDGFIIRGGSAREASGFNSAGGAVLIQNASPRFASCRFEGHFARSGGAVAVLGGEPSFSGCSFAGNMVQNGRGGAVAVGGNGSATFASCAFDSNIVRGGFGANDGGAIFVDAGSGAAIADCAFQGNSATSSSRSIVATGGAIANLGTNVRVSSSSFRSNLSNVGGAIWTAKDFAIVNCVFARNRAIVGDGATTGGGVGGGLVAVLSDVTFADSTSVGNEADDGGGLYSGEGASIAVANSILWMNLDASGTTAQAQIKGPGSKTLEFSCVQNLFASGSFPTCIEADPLFVDADGPDGTAGTADDNLRLLPGSPCIDAGSNAAIPAETAQDKDGGPRKRDDPATPDTGSGTAPVVDMGAYEFGGAWATATIVVEGGAPFTASAEVTVSTAAASGAGIARMSFSNDGASWSPWEPYAPTRLWALVPSDGIQTVFARFADAAGSVLAEAFDSIFLDASPPTGSILIDSGAESTAVVAVTLSLAASDAGTGVAGMRLSDDDVSWSSWEPFAPAKPWNLPPGAGLKAVYVQYRDAAGNVSPSFSDSIVLQDAPPHRAFIRGDANADGELDVCDAVKILLICFAGHPSPCLDAADEDDSGAVDITDAIHNLSYLFKGGSPPPFPFPDCGADTSEDALGCEVYQSCP